LAPRTADCLSELLLVRSDSRLVGLGRGVLKGGCCHAKSNFHACIWSYAHTRDGRCCGSSGQWGTAAFSASARSYVTIDRPGTCSSYKRPRVDFGTAAASPDSA